MTPNGEGFANSLCQPLAACPWRHEHPLQGRNRGVVEPKGASFVFCRPYIGHTSNKCPVSMEIIYLAQPVLHRLGTDRLHARLQARRPPKKQRWRVANAAPKWHISGLGIHESMDVSVQCALEKWRYKTAKQKERYLSGAASCSPGRKCRLHRSQMFTLQKSKSFKKKV